MFQPQERQRTIRSLESRIDQQIEVVARAICEDRCAEREVLALNRLSNLLCSLKGKEAISTAGAKLVEIPVLPRRTRF